MHPQQDVELYIRVRPFIQTFFKSLISFSELIANIDNALEAMGIDDNTYTENIYNIANLFDYYYQGEHS
jgi:hypothetical protein